ncbi:LTA synthase family protein [Frisingicoccus sp.]|uniref:LTA synthase family protein n=1 Tax=Frisingicoccus sp. TaxID=1918627 RepID=UPI003866610F
MRKIQLIKKKWMEWNHIYKEKSQPVYQFMNRFSLIFHAIWAVIINFSIEAMSRHSVIAAWEYMDVSTRVFFYNAFMIFITFSIVYLFKRRTFVRIIISVLWLFLGIVNGVMLLKRVTPFNAQDLKTFSEGLTLFTNYFSVSELVMMAIAFPIVILLLFFLWKKTGKYRGKINYLMGAVIVALSFGGYTVLTDYVIENRIVSTYFSNIAFAYQDYGLPYCFMASVFNTGMSEPNGYTEEKMDEITNDGKMTETTCERDVLPNVIFVQLESFFDTSEFEALKTSTDPLPNLRKMFEEYSSGYCQVPTIGAGTSNTEFEVVTGMSLRYFGPGEYPYKSYLKKNTAESAATAFASLGYGTHAVHNHSGNFYSRAQVFNNIGFDTFVCKEFMNFVQTENGWAKDEVLLTHIEDCLNSTDQQDFVFTISVQGHGSYPEEKLIDNPKITVTGLETEEKNNQWEYYVNQIYEMDLFAKNLVDMMEQRGEPAVVVFYGDHLPTMGLEENDLKSQNLHYTNYVIWDNIGLEKKDGTIPTYQLMADVMERLGFHAGTMFNYHQQKKEDYNYLSDLELLQYDLLYGEQYAYKGEPVITEGHIEMGIRDAEIVYGSQDLEGNYVIYGKNFTKWSQVYVNGEKQSRKFIHKNKIKLTKCELEDWDVVTISQVGSNNTIFRTSAEYVYVDGSLKLYTDELKEEKIRREQMETAETASLESINETIETERITESAID